VAPDDLPQGFAFHHLGYACADLAKDRAQFERLGYAVEGEAFEDPVQGIAGLFLTGAGPRIELLQNLPGSTTLKAWLEQGTRIYHFAYLVPDMTQALAWARTQRAITTVQPVPAVAFGGRHIAFVMLRTGFMLEFIEK